MGCSQRVPNADGIATDESARIPDESLVQVVVPTNEMNRLVQGKAQGLRESEL